MKRLIKCFVKRFVVNVTIIIFYLVSAAGDITTDLLRQNKISTVTASYYTSFNTRFVLLLQILTNYLFVAYLVRLDK